MKNQVKITERMYQETRFARINWTAHLLPLAKAAVQEFSSIVETYGLQRPYISVLSDDVARGYFGGQTDEIWADSILVSFGNRAIPLQAVVPVKGRTRIVAEEQASLVFSQLASGNVLALIYPPTSELVQPLKPYYMVNCWRDPRDVSHSQIMELLSLMAEVDMFCGSITFPNPKGTRLLARLQAKDAAHANGGSRFWVWLQYIFRFAVGVLRLYGIGKPTP